MPKKNSKLNIPDKQRFGAVPNNKPQQGPEMPAQKPLGIGHEDAMIIREARQRFPRLIPPPEAIKNKAQLQDVYNNFIQAQLQAQGQVAPAKELPLAKARSASKQLMQEVMNTQQAANADAQRQLRQLKQPQQQAPTQPKGDAMTRELIDARRSQTVDVRREYEPPTAPVASTEDLKEAQALLDAAQADAQRDIKTKSTYEELFGRGGVARKYKPSVAAERLGIPNRELVPDGIQVASLPENSKWELDANGNYTYSVRVNKSEWRQYSRIVYDDGSYHTFVRPYRDVDGKKKWLDSGWISENSTYNNTNTGPIEDFSLRMEAKKRLAELLKVDKQFIDEAVTGAKGKLDDAVSGVSTRANNVLGAVDDFFDQPRMSAISGSIRLKPNLQTLATASLAGMSREAGVGIGEGDFQKVAIEFGKAYGLSKLVEVVGPQVLKRFPAIGARFVGMSAGSGGIATPVAALIAGAELIDGIVEGATGKSIPQHTAESWLSETRKQKGITGDAIPYAGGTYKPEPAPAPLSEEGKSFFAEYGKGYKNENRLTGSNKPVPGYSFSSGSARLAPPQPYTPPRTSPAIGTETDAAPSQPTPVAQPTAAPVIPSKEELINKRYDELRKTDPEAAKEYGLQQHQGLFPQLYK